MSLTVVILIVVGIVLLTAFYVAAEISIAGSRRSRMQQLQEEGNALAESVLHIVESPSRLSAYIATCQISITICSIVLGFVGQGWLAGQLEPWIIRWGASPAAATSVSVVAILLTLTLAQVFFGELIPKNAGIRIPETLAMGSVRPLMVYYTLFSPFLFVFNVANRAALRLLGMEVSHEHGLALTPDEIRRLASQNLKEGDMHKEEQEWLDSTLRIDEILIKHIMTPRQSIFAAPASFHMDQWTKMLVESPYSRMPIFGRDLDDLHSTVHLLDLLCAPNGEATKFDLVHPMETLDENTPVQDALRIMQAQKAHMVRVAGPNGQTVGIATLEEMVEAVVGSIEDEFDAEPPRFWIQSEGRIVLDASLPARQLARFLDWPVARVRESLQTATSHDGSSGHMQAELQVDDKGTTCSVPFEPSMLERLQWLQRKS